MSRRTAAPSTPESRLSQDATLILSARLLYLLTRVALPPLILSYVPLKEYGIWMICFILFSYLGVGAVGLSNVYIRYVATFNSAGRTRDINGLVSTGLALSGAAGLGLLAATWCLTPMLLELLGVGPAERSVAFCLVFGCVATLVLDSTLGAFGYVLHGLQRIRVQIGVWTVSFIIEAALIVALLRTGWGVTGLLIALGTRYLFASFAYLLMTRRYFRDLELSARHLSWDALRLFLGYGSVVQLSGVMATLLYSAEKLIAGFFVGPSAAALLDIGQKIPMMTSQLVASTNALWMPAFAHLRDRSQASSIRSLYRAGTRFLGLGCALPMGWLAIFGGPVLTVWLGSGLVPPEAVLVLALFSFPFHLHIVTGPASAYHRGVGRASRELLYPFLQLSLIVLGFVALVPSLGWSLSLVVCVVSSAMVLSALAYLFWSHWLLELPSRELTAGVLLPSLLPYGVGALIWMLLPESLFQVNGRLDLFFVLAFSASLYVPAVLLLFAVGVCSAAERRFVARQLYTCYAEVLRPAGDALRHVLGRRIEGH